MRVEVMSHTPAMLDVISRAAGTCYGRDDVSINRVRNCLKNGHMSVFEHASVTFRVYGISRACSHQLVRHRLASYSQESQRYNRYELSGDEWYVVPPKIKMDSLRLVNYRRTMHALSDNYQSLLLNGVPPEDARFILPEATKTTVVVTMNLRELHHFIKLRFDSHAQWEIYELAKRFLDCLEECSEAIHDMFCESLGFLTVGESNGSGGSDE